MRYPLAIVIWTGSAIAGCLPVDTDQIRVRDLGLVDARFNTIDPNQSVGYAPTPGAKRVFWPAELSRLAEKNGVLADTPFVAMCFERSTRIPDSEEIINAIRKWAPPDAVLEIREQSRAGIPAGELVIPRPASFRPEQDGTNLLRGFVRFGAGQRSPFWVRIRAHVKQHRVIASRVIAGQSEIRADDLQSEEFEGGLEASAFVTTIQEAVGRVAKRRFVPGSPIPKDGLAEPRDVRRGEFVHVDVRGERLHLAFEGLADGSGSVGQTVMVRNPSSGKSFAAKVTGANAVLVSSPSER